MLFDGSLIVKATKLYGICIGKASLLMATGMQRALGADNISKLVQDVATRLLLPLLQLCECTLLKFWRVACIHGCVGADWNAQHDGSKSFSLVECCLTSSYFLYTRSSRLPEAASYLEVHEGAANNIPDENAQKATDAIVHLVDSIRLQSSDAALIVAVSGLSWLSNEKQHFVQVVPVLYCRARSRQSR